MTYDDKFVEIITKVLTEGKVRNGRNGYTLGIFGYQFELDDLTNNCFPLLNLRRIYYKPVFGELAAFFNMPICIEDFKAYKCNYWDQWANEDGSINVDYGNAWSNYNGVNQIKEVINSLKNDPHGRRHLISGWRPDRLSELSLPCCHYAYQWYVTDKGELDMIWVQRSVDLMIGLPSDVILAAAWNIVMAYLTGYKPGKLIFQLGDVHIYEEHLATTMTLLQRYDTHEHKSLPTYKYIPSVDYTNYRNFNPNQIIINGYDPAPTVNFLLKS